MPPKRAAKESKAETQAVNKRYRQAIDDVAEEYVCPITAELPIDPVTAEDGRFYERHAIEEWFSRQPRPQVKSPVTNELMGKRLFPAVQVRNSLKRLVESGAISGSKADAWKKAKADEAAVAALRGRAEGGDASAMYGLGCAYQEGKRGLKKDETQAFTWLKRAADLKDVGALTDCGVLYLNGQGVERSQSRALIMLGAAATLGSEHACGILGRANAEGARGAMGWTRTRRRPRGGTARCKSASAATPPRRAASGRPLGCATIRRDAKHLFARHAFRSFRIFVRRQSALARSGRHALIFTVCDAVLCCTVYLYS